MARSRTPPPLSDRKRVIADAHRRRSSAFVRAHSSPADSEEVEAGLFEDDAMDVDESPSYGAAKLWRKRQSKETGVSFIEGSSRANGKPDPRRTPERNTEDFVLPTWTPLAAPSTSSNASETEEPPPSTSASDSTMRRAHSGPSREAGPRGPTTTPRAGPASSTRPRPEPPVYDPYQGFRMALGALRHLPADIIPSGLIESAYNMSTRGIAVEATTDTDEGVTSEAAHKRKHSGSPALLRKAPLRRENNHMEASNELLPNGTTSGKGKGKARDISPEVPELDAYDDEEQQENDAGVLSPEIPHPPLPDDEHEDDMQLDAEDSEAEPARSSSRTSLRPRSHSQSRWLADPRTLRPGAQYFVGKRPPPAPARDKGKAREEDQPKPKRRRAEDHTDQWVNALNAAGETNARLMGLSPPRPSSHPYTAQGHADVINAASKHNTRLNKLVGARTDRDADTSSPAGRKAAKDLRPRAKRKRPLAAASSAPEPAAGPFVAAAGGCYLDLTTWTWRRDEPASAAAAAAAAASPRSDAGPSSAVPGASPSTGAAKRPRGRPRLSDELRKTPRPAPAGTRPRGRPPLPPHLRKNQPTGRPRGRPRKSAPAAELEGTPSASVAASPEKAQQPEKPKRPRGRPRKRPLPAPPPQALLAPPRTPPPPTMSLLDIQLPITPTLLRRAQAFPATDESESSSMTLVQPAAHAPLRQPAVPKEEEESSDIERPAVPEEEEEGSDVVEYVNLSQQAKARPTRAREKSVELSAADLEPSPFVASPQEDASSVAKAPHEVLTWPMLSGQDALQPEQSSSLEQAVARAVSELHARAAASQLSAQESAPSRGAEPMTQDQIPDDEDEDVAMAAAASDLADDSAVPEYQSMLDLVHALAAYITAHPHGRPPGPFFIGSYAMLIDEKTRVGDTYARGVAGQVRETLKGKAGWTYKSRLEAMSASFTRGQQSVQLSYTCGCPYRPSEQQRVCGGSVHITVREVQGMPAAYAGVKGVRVVVRVEH